MRSLFIFILLFTPSLAIAQSKTRLPDPLKVAAERGGAIRRPAAAPMAAPEELWKKNPGRQRRRSEVRQGAGGFRGVARRQAALGLLRGLDCHHRANPGRGIEGHRGNALTPPEPHAFSSFEQLSEVVDALQPTGPLMAACAPAWTALKLTAVQFFTLAVSGAVGLSALGIAIP